MSRVAHARRARFVVAILLGLVCSLPDLAAAQPTASQPANPLAGDSKAIDSGRNIYRGRCAVCHGMDAKGYRGTDLTTGEWVHGGSDEQIFRTIAVGVPGTEMPGNVNMSEDEVWMVMAYLGTLSSPGASAERGDAARGEQLYWAKAKGDCGQCHMIGTRGGRLGPNLSRIGAARSASVLAREIRRPGEVIPVGFETITVVTRDGRRIRGLRKNEDTFSVQMMTASEELRSFSKREVDVQPDEQSLMPAYGPERLTDTELDDIVRYLRTLKGRPALPGQ
jgi:cytochrome c oxidase cbb3-type subunit III